MTFLSADLVNKGLFQQGVDAKNLWVGKFGN